MNTVQIDFPLSFFIHPPHHVNSLVDTQRCCDATRRAAPFSLVFGLGSKVAALKWAALYRTINIY